ERECDLEQVGVAGTFADPVDRPVDPGRGGADGGDGGGGGETEVVVAVEMDGDAGADPLADRGDEELDRLRCSCADRVDDDHLPGPRVDGAGVDALEEGEIGAGAVDAE